MKKILANSAILTLVVALFLSMSLTSCGPKASDKATVDEMTKFFQGYDKAIADLDNMTKTMALDPANPDAPKGMIDQLNKKIQDAAKAWADNYEKNWKTKLSPEDITKFEKQNADLGTKAKAAFDNANKKFEDLKKAAVPPAEGAPAPEAAKK
jgi:chromosome condensin MukBEF ATPase and DNA-binding subunit MukB